VPSPTRLRRLAEAGDPSSARQAFAQMNVRLLCCRYWWLGAWEARDQSIPYWRMYWNRNRGGVMSLGGSTWRMRPDRVYLIPPNTAFESRLARATVEATGGEYLLYGSRIETSDDESALAAAGHLLHLFVHFSLGQPHDAVAPQIFEFAVDEGLREQLERLTAFLRTEPERLDAPASLLLQGMLLALLSRVPAEAWPPAPGDPRIVAALAEIESAPQRDLSNPALAARFNMSTNGFARLFRRTVGASLQRFVQQRRIERACILLHHTRHTIDAIAEQCGFCDRYHFSRMFKKEIGVAPAAYRAPHARRTAGRRMTSDE
jgi:AraC-like DNA-binding protein